MRPLITEKPCLTCHAAQGYTVGDIRGGISISVPFSPYAVEINQHRIFLGFAHLIICGFGFFGLWKGNALLRSSQTVFLMNEERHRTILETAMDGFWLVDAQGHLVEVNQTYCRNSGYREQELLTMSVADLEAAQEGDQVTALIQKILVEGEDRFESQHRRKDGSIFDVEISAQHRPSIDGHIAVFLRDITESKQVENRLKYSLSLLSSSLESTADGILIVDRQGKIARWNKKFAEM